MVMDFGFIKAIMMEVIHEPCDHAMIWYDQDPMYKFLSRSYEVEGTNNGWKNYLMSVVPTAENLAKHWFHKLDNGIQNHFNGLPITVTGKLVQVNVHETPNCMASYPYIDYAELQHSHLTMGMIN